MSKSFVSSKFMPKNRTLNNSPDSTKNNSNWRRDISFLKGSAEISNEDKELLTDIGQIISKIEDSSIEIGGHADGGSGDDFVNDYISKVRAERVYEYLSKIGIDMSLITFVGYGSRHQIYKDERDRRIEFKVLEHD